MSGWMRIPGSRKPLRKAFALVSMVSSWSWWVMTSGSATFRSPLDVRTGDFGRRREEPVGLDSRADVTPTNARRTQHDGCLCAPETDPQMPR